MPKTMTRKQKKAKLQSELRDIEKAERQRFDDCIKEIMDLPESKEVQKLRVIDRHWTMKVEVKVDCELDIPPFNDEMRESIDGYVNAKIVDLPKGYDIERYFSDDIDLAYSPLDAISPEIKERLKNLRSAEKSLKCKAIKIAEMYGYEWKNILHGLVDVLES